MAASILSNGSHKPKAKSTNGKNDGGSIIHDGDTHSLPGKTISSVTFLSDDKSHDESILGASRAAVEGTIYRRSRVEKSMLMSIPRTVSSTSSKLTNKSSKHEEIHEDPIGPMYGEPSGQLARLQDVLAKIYEPNKTVSFLGATMASAEGTTSRRLSRTLSSTLAETYSKSTIALSETTINNGGDHKSHQNLHANVFDAPVTKWKPTNCPMRYAKLYPMPDKKHKDVEIAIPPTVEAPKVHFDVKHGPWCGCCMEESFDPYKLPCGHSFCRRCIVDTNFFLLRDHAAVVKDTRAVMRCPLRHCKAVIPCLPLINGDFRFKLVRPEDKVSFKEPKLNLCEQHRLHTYKIRIDVDVSKRKSDDLFDGYDDVTIIP